MHKIATNMNTAKNKLAVTVPTVQIDASFNKRCAIIKFQKYL